jgi:hypothetical protein
VIAACILIQTRAGQAAIGCGAARLAGRLGDGRAWPVPATLLRAQARDIDDIVELAKLVASGPDARRRDADDELPGRSPGGTKRDGPPRHFGCGTLSSTK